MGATLVILAILSGCASTPGNRANESTSPAPSPPALGSPSGADLGSFPNIAGIDFAKFPVSRASAGQSADGRRTLHVAPGARGRAGAFASLEDAMREVKEGDAVILGDGEYEVADPECDCGVRIGAPRVTLAAENPGKAVMQPRPGDERSSGIIVAANDVTIDGVDIRGFPQAAIAIGTGAGTVSNLVLSRVAITAGSNAITAASPESGESGSLPLVDGLLISEVTASGTQSTQVGIDCGPGPCVNVRISRTRVTLLPDSGGGSGADAIAIESGDNVVVENCVVVGAAADGVDLKSTRSAVANTIVHDVRRNGVKLWRGGDVINSLIYNTGADAAIVFEHPARYRIIGSVVAFHERRGGAYAATVSYDHRGQGRLEVVNSIFFENSGALWVAGHVDLDMQNSIFHGSVEGQLVVWAQDPEIVAVPGAGDAPFADLGRAGAARRVFDVDPAFVDSERGDFRLRESSPARGAGTSSVEAYPAFDIDGKARGEKPNLGPYQ